jgi:hypothetical protein
VGTHIEGDEKIVIIILMDAEQLSNIGNNAESDLSSVQPQELQSKPEIEKKIEVTKPPSIFKRNKFILWGLVFLVGLATVGLLFFIYKNLTSPKEKKEAERKEVGEGTEVRSDLVRYYLKNNLSLMLPKDWEATFTNNTESHFLVSFVKDKKDKSTEVEIEVASESLLNSLNFGFFEDDLVEYSLTENRKINNLDIELKNGKENFQKSERKVTTALLKQGEGVVRVSIHYYSLDNDDFKLFNKIVDSISKGKKQAFNLAGNVYASEDVRIPLSIPEIEYKEVEVMGDVIEARIEKTDPEVKDGYAKGYRFMAFKGQRLTVVAAEDRGSFINTGVYDESGSLVTGHEMNTRTEYDVQTTGNYFVVVRSFRHQEGKFKFKVFDRDQFENKMYLKYANGEEKFLDYNKGIQVGERELAIMWEFMSPVEMLENEQFKYRMKPKEFGPDLGDTVTPIKVYSIVQTYKEFLQSGSVLPEWDPSNEMDVDFTRLGPTRILITPKRGLFKTKIHVSLTEQNTGLSRFITENPSGEDEPKPTLSPTLIPSPIDGEDIVEAGGTLEYEGYSVDIKAKFPVKGGDVNIEVMGACVGTGDGTFEGKKAGSEKARIEGKLAGICDVLNQKIDVSGDFYGDVYLTEGRAEGKWEGSAGGLFRRKDDWSFTFNPVK